MMNSDITTSNNTTFTTPQNIVSPPIAPVDSHLKLPQDIEHLKHENSRLKNDLLYMNNLNQKIYENYVIQCTKMHNVLNNQAQSLAQFYQNHANLANLPFRKASKNYIANELDIRITEMKNIISDFKILAPHILHNMFEERESLISYISVLLKTYDKSQARESFLYNHIKAQNKLIEQQKENLDAVNWFTHITPYSNATIDLQAARDATLSDSEAEFLYALLADDQDVNPNNLDPAATYTNPLGASNIQEA